MPFGAVENPGLITYRDRLLLAQPERDTPERQRGMRNTMAHELAHQWFGNLVTQAWWDDVWLSEGFATWLGGKISDLELPSFERTLAAVNSRVQIMRVDASAATRPVRLEMHSRKDMDRVYGGIVYQKGAAILRMLEEWLGAEAFQRGLQAYLKAHSMANASTDDLAAALSEGSGIEVRTVLHSFLDQSGYPTITAECGSGLRVDSKWTVPVCVQGSGCTVVSESKAGETAAPGCPGWIWPNRGGSGYFRVSLSESALQSVVDQGWEDLTAPERISVIDDTTAGVAGRKIKIEAVVKLLPVMIRDPEPAVGNAAYRLLMTMMTSAGPEDRAKCETAARELLDLPRGRR
jgi:alanyl aminopeptidase